MAMKIAYFIKTLRRNGQVGLLCEPGTNIPQRFNDLDEVKKTASFAKKVLSERNRHTNGPNRDQFPATIDKVWIFKTFVEA